MPFILERNPSPYKRYNINFKSFEVINSIDNIDKLILFQSKNSVLNKKYKYDFLLSPPMSLVIKNIKHLEINCLKFENDLIKIIVSLIGTNLESFILSSDVNPDVENDLLSIFIDESLEDEKMNDFSIENLNSLKQLSLTCNNPCKQSLLKNSYYLKLYPFPLLQVLKLSGVCIFTKSSSKAFCSSLRLIKSLKSLEISDSITCNIKHFTNFLQGANLNSLILLNEFKFIIEIKYLLKLFETVSKINLQEFQIYSNQLIDPKMNEIYNKML